MHAIPRVVKLRNLHSGYDESASIIRLERIDARCRIDNKWWDEPWITRDVRKEAKQKAGDYWWKWRKFVGEFQSKYWVQRLVVQTADEEIQGAIIFDPNRESVRDPGHGTVYVEYIAAAPRNRIFLTKTPLYKGTGTALLLLAAHYSLKVGHGGRLTLRPLQNVVNWYVERHSFSPVVNRHDGRSYLELSPEKAYEALEKVQSEGVF